MKIVVTAGPTREYLDPVRFLSNPSTGKMGFAIAAEAARRGHEVTLIAGPVALKTPKGVERVDVVSAREMLAAVKKSLLTSCFGDLSSEHRSIGASDHRRNLTIFISTAAVADWRPAKCAAQKLKKSQMSGVLKLVRNPDILKTIDSYRKRSNAVGLRTVGFAAETDHVLDEAARKCREKGLSFIVANDVTQSGCGVGTDTNRVTFVCPDGTQRKFPLMTKRMVAKRILDAVSSVAAGREE